MKVSELISLLDKYPQDAPVCVTWEGQVVDLNSDEIYLVTKLIGYEGAVFIDGDSNCYKAHWGGESRQP